MWLLLGSAHENQNVREKKHKTNAKPKKTVRTTKNNNKYNLTIAEKIRFSPKLAYRLSLMFPF